MHILYRATCTFEDTGQKLNQLVSEKKKRTNFSFGLFSYLYIEHGLTIKKNEKKAKGGFRTPLVLKIHFINKVPFCDKF